MEPPKRDLPLSLDEWASYFSYAGNTYPFLNLNQTAVGGREEMLGRDFASLATGAYQSNGPIYACMFVRFSLFAEARFQFRQLRSGRPGDLFGTQDLGVLERPWPNGTTGDLLARAITDVDLAGNFFVHRQGDRLERLRPDWVTILIGGPAGSDLAAGDLGAQVIGYAYQPGGPAGDREPVFLPLEQVAHWAPVPDPTAWYRGMSWLHPILREVMGDSAATTHKLKFFEQGATPNMVVTFDAGITLDKFERFVSKFSEGHEGVANAYRTLFLAGGADAKVVGSDLRQIDFKQTQGAGETRIAMAAGVPPVVVGMSEGLQGSSLNAGNYAQARRRLADGTMRPLWRSFAAAIQTIVPPPPGAELWYDDRDVPFLREDLKDVAEIKQLEASMMKVLIDAGFTPESVTDAVTAGDWKRLKHTGLFSVQLQPPMPEGPAPIAEEAGRALAALMAGHLKTNGNADALAHHE